MTDRSLRQIYNWRVPPNWSRRDWHEEMKAEAIAAAWEAEHDFDPTRGVPLPAFVHQRVLARALTRHRREWAYARPYNHSSQRTAELILWLHRYKRASQHPSVYVAEGKRLF